MSTNFGCEFDLLLNAGDSKYSLLRESKKGFNIIEWDSI